MDQCLRYKLVCATLKHKEIVRSVLCTRERIPSKPTTQRELVQIPPEQRTIVRDLQAGSRTTPQHKDIVSVRTPYSVLFCAKLELV